MTNQEAITQLKEINREAHIYSEAVEMAISALEKQIPKKPAVMIDTWICPSCNNGIEYQFLFGDKVLFHVFHDFCPRCGQAIDWEENEE